MKLLLWCLILVCSSSVYADHAAVPAEGLKLLGRSHAADILELSEADQKWLHAKGSFTLGTSMERPAPFELLSSKNDYEGITADYAELLADLLHVGIHVRRYRDEHETIDALKRGEIDLMVTGGEGKSRDPQLRFSNVYASDQPVLVTRRDIKQPMPEHLKGLRLAMYEHYLTSSKVAERYPEAALTIYPSADKAMNAVAFGQADVYMGGYIEANYLIKRNHFTGLHSSDIAIAKKYSVGFVTRQKETQLLAFINRALDAVSLQEKMAIIRRWSAVPSDALGMQPIRFSPEEEQWLATHSKVKVAVMDANPPIAFIDGAKQFRGISADILEKISSRIPLTFDVVLGRSNEELIDMVQRGDADIVSTFHTAHRKLNFTRPYWTSPYVFSSRLGAEAPDSLNDMVGKRLAVVTNSRMLDYVTKFYPGVIFVPSANAAQSLALLASGDADGVISPLINTQYLISNYYKDQIRIIGAVGSSLAQLSLGTHHGEMELHSILEKVLISIPPDEIEGMTNRWFGSSIVERDYWKEHRVLIFQVVACFGLLLVGVFCWVFYLKRLIDKRNAAELKFNEQIAFMRTLIDSLPHPILARDYEGYLLLCNKEYLQVVGGAAYEAVVGTRVTDCEGISPEEAARFEQEYQEVMESGEPRIEDRFFLTAEGASVALYHWTVPFRGMDGKVRGVITGWIDISERARLLDELKSTQLDAENANRAKTTFLATMSHEIRTPMNAIVGMLELAMKKADKGELDRFAIEVAFGAAQGMLGLIGDILDVVRIESGHLVLNPQRTSFKPLVESVIRVFEGLARQKQLELILQFDVQAEREVFVDPLRFKQILSNLVSNAIKFTLEGKVVVEVCATLVSDGAYLRIQIHVRDTGVGISKEDQERLFLPFSQVGAVGQQHSGGSGLGLMISRTLCAMMQGELSLHSVSGIGTQIDVVLEVPILDALPQVEAEAVVEPPHRVLNVLVVDDYPANRLLLQQQLTYLGHEVSDEPDGAHGLRAWRCGHFDVVITDCNMPVMSGYELVRNIRAEEARSGADRCLVLGFTANAQVDEVERCREAGMDDCLFKPISMQALAARISGAVPIFTSSTDNDGETLKALDGFDLSSLEQLTYGNSASIAHLLGDLAQSNEEDMSRLVKLFSEGDVSAIADLTHRIKGGARIIKAQRLIQCCDQVAHDCSEHDATALTESVDTLHQAMDALAQMLASYIDDVEDQPGGEVSRNSNKDILGATGI
ncbi:transporter substrate-binding domain-containing protein [Pseudomonas sp. B329]|uniref:transporter substrate-binding domain-containing protein n=1 Tax=Pseudomonas sp. B329 TaxID=1553459 RepID=UPI00200356F9|nr:transporter substrate-binding domain-containing protein [Pseudomonas sp. B329]MCK3863799.1 transporter substrate-binding domain-containing protein [Pseudomonas sp. B329]